MMMKEFFYHIKYTIIDCLKFIVLRVHVSPSNIIVPVPPFQHSPILGHCASSHTVWSPNSLTVLFNSSYLLSLPPGAGTRNQFGLLPSGMTPPTLGTIKLTPLSLEVSVVDKDFRTVRGATTFITWKLPELTRNRTTSKAEIVDEAPCSMIA